MVYAATTENIFYWDPDQPFVIHRSHHVWFDECNYSLSIEYKKPPGSLPLQQYPEILVYNPYLLNFIPCELDLTSTPFFATSIITYEIELPSFINKVGFNLLDYEDFKIPYITDAIPNSPPGRQLPTQDKQNVWIIYIYIGNSLSQIKVHLMNSISTKLHV